MRVQLLIFAVAILIQTGPVVWGDERAAVPDAAAQEKAEQVVKELFKADYAKKKQTARRELSIRLYQQGVFTKDDMAVRFVLFRECRDLAAQAAMPLAALKAVDELAKDFEVKGLEMKMAVVEKSAESAKTTTSHKNATVAALEVLNEALVSDSFPAAEEVLKVAAAAAAKSRSKPVTEAVERREKDVQQAREQYDRFQKAEKSLKAQPDDADASLVKGRYSCLWNGNWSKGLPALAAGSDARLKELARKDLDDPSGADQQVELADAWLALADKEAGLPRKNLQARAHFWYLKAVNKLEGIKHAKVETRIRSLERTSPALRFFSLPLEQAATLVSTESMFGGADFEVMVFPTWGRQTILDVPYNVIDPKGKSVRNAIVLNCPKGSVARRMPQAVRVPCDAPAKAIHFLSGVSAYGFPYTREPTVTLLVRLNYQNGTKEVHYFINGVHFVDWYQKDDSPISRKAVELVGKGKGQIRYMVVYPGDVTTPIKAIDLIKGPKDATAPVIMAMTVEKPGL
jgi:hypothetical protein